MIISPLTYVLISMYNTSNNNQSRIFSLSWGTNSKPVYLSKGTQTELPISIQNNLNNQVTLTLSGSGTSMASLIQIINYGQSYSIMKINGNNNGINLLLSIPNNTTSGQYSIQVTGTNLANISKELTYSYTVL